MSENSTIGYGSMQVFVQTSDGGAAFLPIWNSSCPREPFAGATPCGIDLDALALGLGASFRGGGGGGGGGGKWFQLRFPECWSDSGSSCGSQSVGVTCTS